jgi:predicted RNA-binding protein with PUA-like domain
MFSWIPIHQETVRKILGFSEPQGELLAALRDMEQQGLKVISLDDKSATGEIPLAEIDPFTFFSSFNRGITDENRKENWRFIKKRWNLSSDVPDDFAGIPVVHNMKSWFFPYARNRDSNQVEALWQLFKTAAKNAVEHVDAALFERCMSLDVITINKLTIGLFWIDPENYLPADQKTRAYVEHEGVSEKPIDHDSYRRWLDEVRSKVGVNYAQVSYDAHVWATQGEPPPAARHFWVYAPGRKARRWDDFYDERILAIDWEELDDLRTYKDKEAIRQRLQEHDSNQSSKVNDTLACWQFVREMRPGDIVFAKYGMGKVVGYGSVTGDYGYDVSRPSFKHLRSMQWLGKGEWPLAEDERLPVKTLTDITRYPDLVQRISELVGLDLKKLGQPVPPKPPRNVSYWWLNANPNMWSFEEAAVGETQTYTSHNENGNKRQKYKYFEEVQPGDIVVGYVTSPQREIVGICRVTKGLHDSEEGQRIEFEKIERLRKPVLYETLKAIPGLQECEPLINHQGSLFKLREEEYEIIRALIDETNPPEQVPRKPYTKQMAMQGLFLPETQFDEALDALREKKNIVLQGPPGVGKTFIAKRLAKALIGVDDPQRIEMIQFHQSYAYEDFIQGFRPTAEGTFDLKYCARHAIVIARSTPS